MARLPAALSRLVQALGAELPRLLGANLVGIYLYGSLTQRAFDPRRSDVDGIVLTRRNLQARERERLGRWFAQCAADNPWTARLQLSFLRQATLLADDPGACLYQFGALSRSGSDGNPLIWLNVLESGRVLHGPPAADCLPPITPEQVQAALLRETHYLRAELADPASTWCGQPAYRCYAVLTLCRIRYTLQTGRIAAKPAAARWALRRLPAQWHALVEGALAAHTGPQQAAPARLPLRRICAFVADTLTHFPAAEH